MSKDVGLEIGLCVPTPCEGEDVKTIVINSELDLKKKFISRLFFNAFKLSYYFQLKALRLMTIQDVFNEGNVRVLCDYDEPKSDAHNVYV